MGGGVASSVGCNSHSAIRHPVNMSAAQTARHTTQFSLSLPLCVDSFQNGIQCICHFFCIFVNNVWKSVSLLTEYIQSFLNQQQWVQPTFCLYTNEKCIISRYAYPKQKKTVVLMWSYSTFTRKANLCSRGFYSNSVPKLKPASKERLIH